jgi:hypothetical protein
MQCFAGLLQQLGRTEDALSLLNQTMLLRENVSALVEVFSSDEGL